jgi:hypothetical protein
MSYLSISNVFYRADAIAADGRGNFGKDTPSGLVYHSGLYLTPSERDAMVRTDSQALHVAEDSLGLGLLND